MALKKEMKAWAVKLRGRSFYLSSTGQPWTFMSMLVAVYFADRV